MAEVIEQDGTPVEFVAHYWRYHVEHRDPCETAKEAASFLEAGSDYGELAPVGVVLPDGREIKHRSPEFEALLAAAEPDREPETLAIEV